MSLDQNGKLPNPAGTVPFSILPGTEWRPWCGLEALYLGKVIVGRVSASRMGRNSQASWIFNLNGDVAFWKTARTVEDARIAVEQSLRDWLLRAGIAA